ncbi:hypothetical protein PanWU01x14_084460 [Parasponia andersonii]|uniref:Fringe-like glycosyltransferase domain-containing protein n=1 Tax=Parasponia andersonii TaxID=3476 RepID=A0A2P5D9M3_PARAD|nr:hypothetical protein PanWU01x14_084460 [Parasponia andersonii]
MATATSSSGTGPGNERGRLARQRGGGCRRRGRLEAAATVEDLDRQAVPVQPQKPPPVGDSNLEDRGGMRLFVMGDDDAVFVTDSLVRNLRKYDHNQMYYIGSLSESHLQNICFSYGMPYSGGGFAISYPFSPLILSSPRLEL